MRQTNYEHLLTLSQKSVAKVLVNLNKDICLCCPLLRQQECNDNCVKGLHGWLKEKYIRESYVWKGTENDE